MTYKQLIAEILIDYPDGLTLWEITKRVIAINKEEKTNKKPSANTLNRAIWEMEKNTILEKGSVVGPNGGPSYKLISKN